MICLIPALFNEALGLPIGQPAIGQKRGIVEHFWMEWEVVEVGGIQREFMLKVVAPFTVAILRK